MKPKTPNSALRRYLMLSLSLGVHFTAACAPEIPEEGFEAITAAAMDAHLRFLAGDFVEGRRPGTRGAELAASYIAQQFQGSGLAAGVGDSSFFQKVAFLAVTSELDLSFRARGGAVLSIRPGEDVVAWTRSRELVELEADVLFAGYGFSNSDPEQDPAVSADLRGKVLIFLAGRPGSALGGDAVSGSSYGEFKFAEAARRGAAGAFIVQDPEDTGLTWGLIRNTASGERLELESEPGARRPEVQGWLSRGAARELVAMAGLDFESLKALARSESFRPVGLGLQLTLRATNQVRRASDVNVIGVLPGRDSDLSREVVIFSAHYDHLGIGPPQGSDSIYNGAYDNASGTALLLCLARAFGSLERPPLRSVLFLAVTGGSRGSLGASYYLENPTFPIQRTVASINLDAVNLWGATEDIRIPAAGSGLAAAAREAAVAEKLQPRESSANEQPTLFPPDHAMFQRAGIPALHLSHGTEYVGRLPGWGEQMLTDYRLKHLYQPSDEYRPGLDYAGAVQQGRVAYRMGMRLADSRHKPD